MGSRQDSRVRTARTRKRCAYQGRHCFGTIEAGVDYFDFAAAPRSHEAWCLHCASVKFVASAFSHEPTRAALLEARAGLAAGSGA